MIEKQDAEVARLDKRAIAEITTPQSRAAATVHAADKAAEIAARIKDATALERALLAQLEHERDFAGVYTKSFPDGRPPKSKSATSGAVSGQAWCLAHGFSLRTVQRWLELLDEVLHEKQTAIIKRCWELAALWQSASYSSESVEWYTPAVYLEAVWEALGNVDLDPASNAQANETIGATQIFTKDDDGLRRDWHGRVFLNPPYGKTDGNASLAGAFCQKAVDQYERGNIEACIILVNSLHSQSWQAPLYKHTVCFVDHRIQFVSGDGEENKNPTFQNIFVYVGKDEQRFATAFKRFGYVMRSVHE